MADFDAVCFIELLKTTRVSWAKQKSQKCKIGNFMRKNIIFAMRGPQIDNVLVKAVIDNVCTLPRFARTLVKQCIFQGGD